VKVDSGSYANIHSAKSDAQKLERLGFDGFLSAETAHDPFLPLALAADGTDRIEIMTSIAVAFARNPMLLANLGHDLNAFSKGRFTLGMGSQIKPHITKRFSMPWSDPAARMKELIEAVHAIWDCWYEDKPLKFEGRYYSHTLMTPMFTPTDTQYGKPRIFLAAVGPLMTRTAAEVADGMIIHAFTTEKYIREVTVPTVEKALQDAGRKRSEFQLTYPMFVVTGETEEKFNEIKQATCTQIAFYGSTPAYKGVLDIHGWTDLFPELNRLSKLGEWDVMANLITDDVLDAFAVVGEPGTVVGQIKKRYGDLLDRASVSLLNAMSEDVASQIITELKAA